MNLMLTGPSLLGTYGHTHKRQRKLLNPVFSAAHMRNLTPVFHSISDKVCCPAASSTLDLVLIPLAWPFQLRIALETRLRDGPRELDILEWMGRTALELVGQGMMGYSFDPLVEEVHNDFAEALKAFMCAPSPSPFSFLLFLFFLACIRIH